MDAPVLEPTYAAISSLWDTWLVLRDPENDGERNRGLRLYVAGPTFKSVNAFRNLEALCEEHLAWHYRIEIVDLLENPELAHVEWILAVPTVIRKLPFPIRKMRQGRPKHSARKGVVKTRVDSRNQARRFGANSLFCELCRPGHPKFR